MISPPPQKREHFQSARICSDLPTLPPAKCLLYASCLVPRCQESSLKVWEHLKPINTKEPRQLPLSRPRTGFSPTCRQSCCLPHVPSVPSANRDRNCQHFLRTYCAPGTIPSTLRELTHLLPKPHGICWRERNALAQIPTWFLLPISSYAVKLT